MPGLYANMEVIKINEFGAFGSYKHYRKQFLDKNQKGYEVAQDNRAFWFNFYRDFFIKLITNYFTWENMPPTIDKAYLEKTLCFEGYGAFVEHEDLGLIFTKGTAGGRLDNYDNPTVFRPVNNARSIKFRDYKINWYDDMLDPQKAVIVGNNNFYRGSLDWLLGFCDKLAQIEQTIQLNRNAQIRPYIIITEKEKHLSFRNLFNKLMQQEPVIYLEAQKDDRGNLDAVQLQDRVAVLNTKTDFLLDKLHDEKQRVINQVLTYIGINNNAVDKAERLTSAEATSNNGLINACIEVMLKTRKRDIDRVNKTWDINPPIEVNPSRQIEMYNTEEVKRQLEFDTEAAASAPGNGGDE